ncbi:hypothetical protein FKW77_002009 [Venturia effusa]|uniref:JmjC domain-containing protein n=1 Tax=Venturia effusa TaxID=50376 RepID=A0A517LEW4_9PEZI|nr:hypothetical protein FKW77_002009 [Venturia effusa]
MPLPRPLPFRLKFSGYPGTKKSAVRQPDHFKWKFVKRERPLLFEKGQFKDEIGAVGRWFGVRKGRGEEERGDGDGKEGDGVVKEGEGDRKEGEDDFDQFKYKKVVDPARHGKPKGKQVLHLRSQWLKGPKEVDEAYFKPFGDKVVPLEKVTRIPNGEGEGKDAVTFERFEAPLFVFLAWNRKKLENPDTYQPGIDLYLAQFSLSDLPKGLKGDLPTPYMISEGGQGVQSSSLWMGVPPTNTPLHKDPNPNCFVQLAGRKKIRMVKPDDGDLAYSTVRNIVAEETAASPFGGAFSAGTFAGLGAKMRGDEMMNGLEKKLMDSLIWGDDLGVWSWNKDETLGKPVKVGPGKFEIALDGAEDDSNVEPESTVSEDISTTAESSTNEESSIGERTSVNIEVIVADQRVKPIPKHLNYRTPSSSRIPLFNGFEAVLEPGDGCFIPAGWWHSLRGIPEEPLGINASVNWWFRTGRLSVATRRRKRAEYEGNTASPGEERGLRSKDRVHEVADSGKQTQLWQGRSQTLREKKQQAAMRKLGAVPTTGWVDRTTRYNQDRGKSETEADTDRASAFVRDRDTRETRDESVMMERQGRPGIVGQYHSAYEGEGEGDRPESSNSHGDGTLIRKFPITDTSNETTRVYDEKIAQSVTISGHHGQTDDAGERKEGHRSDREKGEPDSPSRIRAVQSDDPRKGTFEIRKFVAREGKVRLVKG